MKTLILNGSPRIDENFDKAYDTACTLLHHMNCNDIIPLVSFGGTNVKAAICDEDCMKGIEEIVDYFGG